MGKKSGEVKLRNCPICQYTFHLSSKGLKEHFVACAKAYNKDISTRKR